VALIWTQLFQRAVDRRDYQPPVSRPVFLWVDEAQKFTIEQDAEFQTTARSKGISVVRLSQNVPNFSACFGRDGKALVDTLLGNHVTKIFHRQGDPAGSRLSQAESMAGQADRAEAYQALCESLGMGGD